MLYCLGAWNSHVVLPHEFTVVEFSEFLVSFHNSAVSGLAALGTALVRSVRRMQLRRRGSPSSHI